MSFVRSLAFDLNVDETTLILLLVIALFSPDRERIHDRELIAAQQERYVATPGELRRKYVVVVITIVTDHQLCQYRNVELPTSPCPHDLFILFHCHAVYITGRI